MAQIVWDPIALEQVHEIYDYYYEHMSPQVAYDLWNDLITAPDVLVATPQVGQKELLFENEMPEYRYLVVRKHWKLLYFELDGVCHIALVWDTRNNPMILTQLITNT